ncbi:hypothetical protein [Bacillus cereus group sp. BfR-BA-00999]|uniref:hypothetical protein n=1 Tax=Bacillus cereus group sp. BfR-BA-00999 TaxID=3094871 RepID=UPI0029C2FC76|nr:hypothetical protein [Bacillus cereus group sp. BfR-BA-00999]MDX5885031.1 hypothetical protein [Bacillus cereus group sp. BfR-BA-00999]
MKKYGKVLLTILAMAVIVGIFMKESHADKKLSDVEQKYEQLEKENKKIVADAQKQLVKYHVIVESTLGGEAKAYPIDDNDSIFSYIHLENKNYKQGDIISVEMNGLGRVLKQEKTQGMELEWLHKRFNDIIEDYMKGFALEAEKNGEKKVVKEEPKKEEQPKQEEKKEVTKEEKKEEKKEQPVKQAQEKNSTPVEAKSMENKSVAKQDKPVKREEAKAEQMKQVAKAEEKNISNKNKQDELKEKDDSYINSVRQYRITETTNAGLINAEGAKNDKEKVIIENKGFREGDIVEVKYGSSGYHDDMVEVNRVYGEKKIN